MIGTKKDHMKPTAIKLDAALLARVDEMAARLGEHRSTVMRIAMRVGLENLEHAFEAGSAAPAGELVKKLSPSPLTTSQSDNAPRRRLA